MEFVSWESIPQKFRSNLRKIVPTGYFKQRTDEIVKVVKTSFTVFDRKSNMCWYIFINPKKKCGYDMYKYYQPQQKNIKVKVI